MNTQVIRNAFTGAVATVLWLASGTALAQVTYRLTDIGTLFGGETYGSAMNASGQVTGYSFTATRDLAHAFLWTGTAMQDLGTLGGSFSSGYAINASGQVTGIAINATGYTHPFLGTGTDMQDLGTLGGREGVGLAINASGQVTGESYTANNVSHAFLWTGTEMKDLGTLGGSFSYGRAINAAGQVTGWSHTATVGHMRAFLWEGTAMRDLGTLGGTYSRGSAINASGQVTGSATLAGDVASHAVLWTGTTMRDLGTLGGNFAEGYAINASGQVAGYGWTAGDVAFHAFLWDGTAMRDLGALDGYSTTGGAINASGQVTGGAFTADERPYRAILWTGTELKDLNSLIDPADPLLPYVTLTRGFGINDLGQVAAEGTDSRTGRTRIYIVSGPNVVTTPSGSGVSVTPVVASSEGTTPSTVKLTFESVETAGTTTVAAASTPSDGASQPPATFFVGSPAVYYDVKTTASFAGSVTLCFSWQEGQFVIESGIKLFHFENSAWQDVTTSLDVTTNTVCGIVNSLSPFALFEPSFTYTFSGFFQPVDNPPTRNIAKAGSAIPVKFSLNGDQGLRIFYAGYPVSHLTTCDGSAPSDIVTETVTAGGSSLSYNASTGQYTYIWKTDKAWANSCRQLILKLRDGSQHIAQFGFSR